MTAASRTGMIRIIKGICTDTQVAPFLGLKGDFAAFGLYGLTRSPVDLTFDLLDTSRKVKVCARTEHVLRRSFEIRNVLHRPASTSYLLLSETLTQVLTVEITHRTSGSSYGLATILGLPLRVVTRADLFADSLVALSRSPEIDSRHVYDVCFFLEQGWSINKPLVERRTGLPFPRAVEQCIAKVERMTDTEVLRGLERLIRPDQLECVTFFLRADTIRVLKNLFENDDDS